MLYAISGMHQCVEESFSLILVGCRQICTYDVGIEIWPRIWLGAAIIIRDVDCWVHNRGEDRPGVPQKNLIPPKTIRSSLLFSLAGGLPTIIASSITSHHTKPWFDFSV